MKTWNKPEVEELNFNETAHDWTGIYRDGGYIGDGVISGHNTWKKPEPTPEQTPEPSPDPILDEDLNS